MTKATTTKKKTGEYRNLRPTDGRPELYEFEVKLKSGEWKKFTGLMCDNEADAIKFAQNTADGWMKK